MIIKRELFLKAIEKVNVVIMRNPTLPVLEMILVDIKDNTCSVTATNLETTINYSFDIDTDDKHLFCVSPKDLTNFLSQLDSDFIETTITQSKVDDIYKGTILFEYGLGSNIEFPLGDAEDFPEQLTVPDGSDSFIIDGKVLKDAIFASKSYTGSDPLRPIMTNINITVTANAIRSIATDANILHTIVLESENRLITKSDHLEFMIVNTAIASLLKLPISETEVSITDKNIFYKTEGMTIITTLTEGKYFKWKQVIPTEFQCEITFNKAAFTKGIKIASITSSSSSHQLVFKVKGKELSIVSNDVDYAKKGAFKMPLVESNVTEEFTVALNSKYLTQLLISTPDVENLQFKMNTMKANIMGSIEKQLILIMPMAIL